MNTPTVFAILLIGVIGAQAFPALPALPTAKNIFQIMKYSSSSVLRGNSSDDNDRFRCYRESYTVSAEENGLTDLWEDPKKQYDTIVEEYKKCASLDCELFHQYALTEVILNYFIEVAERFDWDLVVKLATAAGDQCRDKSNDIVEIVDPGNFLPTVADLKCLRNGFTTGALETGVADIWEKTNEVFGKYLQKYELCDQAGNESEIKQCRINQYDAINDLITQFFEEVYEREGIKLLERLIGLALSSCEL